VSLPARVVTLVVAFLAVVAGVVFVAFEFIGAQPRTDWLPPSVAVDPKGFILTGADAAQSSFWPLAEREPCVIETTCPGIFAAGDVRSNTTKRVAFAVGDGALAVTCAHRVLGEL